MREATTVTAATTGGHTEADTTHTSRADPRGLRRGPAAARHSSSSARYVRLKTRPRRIGDTP
jgi:hypothetical protein